MSTAGTKRKVEGGPDVVLLDLHLPSDGHTCRAPDTPGADVIERAGKLYLRLDPALLQQYDSHPPAEVRNKAWGGTCEEIIQRRKREFAKEGAVHGLQDLLLRACPEAAAVARRADLVAPLRGEQWGPGGDLKVTWAWERYRAVNEWMDTQLGTYEAHDQRQPERLKGGELLPHQLAGLRFMLDREATDFRHDLWAPVIALGGRVLWYSPAFARLSPTVPPLGTCGGYLGDLMGLGKTVMTLALIAATLDDQRCPTLVACPTSLVQQWASEVARWIPGAQCVTLSSRGGSMGEQLARHPGAAVVVASYATLARIHVSDAELHRVVFDEAHTLPVARPPAKPTSATVVCAAINARRRWALSGTPMPTEHSMRSVMAALRVQPLGDWDFTRVMVTTMLGNASYMAAQLAACMLRRTDTHLEDVDSLLPPAVVHDVQQVVLTEQEVAVYHGIRQLHGFSFDGIETAQRRIVAGGTYDVDVLRGGMVRRAADTATVRIDPTVADEERCAEGCSICLNEPVGAPEACVPCGHCFCGKCLMAWVGGQISLGRVPKCPLCRGEFQLSGVRLAAPLPSPTCAERGSEVDRQIRQLRDAVDALPRDPRRPDSVLLKTNPAAVAAKVTELLEADASAAVLVFSHFGETLRLIRDLIRDLPGRDGDVATLLGPTHERDQAVARFQAGKARVLLLPFASRRSSGLNLTAANHVVLAERAVVPGEEGQAIGRARRLGQARQVHVWQFAPSLPAQPADSS